MRPDASSITLQQLCDELLALPEGAESLVIRLDHKGEQLLLLLARGQSASELADLLDSHAEGMIGRMDFDAPDEQPPTPTPEG